jgi:hypothetical protein
MTGKEKPFHMTKKELLGENVGGLQEIAYKVTRASF